VYVLLSCTRIGGKQKILHLKVYTWQASKYYCHLITPETGWVPPIHGGKKIYISHITKKQSYRFIFLFKWYTLQESKYYYHLITRETKWVPPIQERMTMQVFFPPLFACNWVIYITHCVSVFCFEQDWKESVHARKFAFLVLATLIRLYYVYMCTYIHKFMYVCMHIDIHTRI